MPRPITESDKVHKLKFLIVIRLSNNNTLVIYSLKEYNEIFDPPTL